MMVGNSRVTVGVGRGMPPELQAAAARLCLRVDVRSSTPACLPLSADIQSARMHGGSVRDLFVRPVHRRARGLPAARDGAPIQVSPKIIDLLLYLVARPSALVPRRSCSRRCGRTSPSPTTR